VHDIYDSTARGTDGGCRESPFKLFCVTLCYSL